MLDPLAQVCGFLVIGAGILAVGLALGSRWPVWLGAGMFGLGCLGAMSWLATPIR
jgi:hypothetical protein